jgi:membrane protein required for colicin V production
VANYLADNTGIATKWLPVVSFLVVFIGVIIIINILAKMIEKAMEITMLGFVNRIGGVIFYVLIDTFIFSIVLFYANQLHFISDKTIADSFCYGYIEPLAPKVMEVLAGALPFLKNVFTDLEKFFSGIAGEPLK